VRVCASVRKGKIDEEKSEMCKNGINQRLGTQREESDRKEAKGE